MNPLKTFYTSDYCDIFHNEELNIVQTEWKGKTLAGEEFRKILNKMIDALRETQSRIILADARRMEMIWKEDREWIVKEWCPNAVKAGFRCQALIVTDDSYNDLALKQILEHYDDKVVETGYFTSYHDAFEWVKNKVISGTLS